MTPPDRPEPLSERELDALERRPWSRERWHRAWQGFIKVRPVELKRLIAQARSALTPQGWQTCPVCNGQGTVSRPPHVAGDQATWAGNSTTVVPYPCRVCEGRGIVALPTPPQEPR